MPTIRWPPPIALRNTRSPFRHSDSERGLEHPVALAHLRDVVQAARFRDEIELDAGWRRCGFQHLEKPRKPLRTDTQAHRVLSRPLLHVPHSGLLAVLGPHPAPEAARLDAGGRGQQSQGVNELLRAARRRRQRNSEAHHARAQQQQTYQVGVPAGATALCFCAASSCRRSTNLRPPAGRRGVIPRIAEGARNAGVSGAGAGAPVSPCASRGSWL